MAAAAKAVLLTEAQVAHHTAVAHQAVQVAEVAIVVAVTAVAVAVTAVETQEADSVKFQHREKV